MTKLLSENQLVEGAQIIAEGGLVAYPTETVYGLGADAQNEDAVKRIFSVKNRPSKKALAIQFDSIKSMSIFFPNINKETLKIFKTFKNGVTVVLAKELIDGVCEKIAPSVLAGEDSIAVRIPSDKFARKFLKTCGRPIAAPSANTSAGPSPTTWNAVYDDLNKRIDAIFMGNPCKIGKESSIIKLERDKTGARKIRILRDGAIPREVIAKKLKAEII